MNTRSLMLTKLLLIVCLLPDQGYLGGCFLLETLYASLIEKLVQGGELLNPKLENVFP
jgi:hypothetical protein